MVFQSSPAKSMETVKLLGRQTVRRRIYKDGARDVFGMLTAYNNHLYTNKWSSEEELSSGEAIVAVVSAEDPSVGCSHTPHTLSRFHYLKQSGYSNEAAVRLAAPDLSDVQPSFLYDEQQLCNKLLSFFPSGENTEVQSYGKVEKELKKVRHHLQSVVPQLRGSTYIHSSTFVRIRYNTAQNKWHNELDYLKEWPCVNKNNIKRVRCVYLHLSEVDELKSSVLQVKNKNILWKKGHVAVLSASQKRRSTANRSNQPSISLDFRVFICPTYDFSPYGFTPRISDFPMETIICIAQRRDYRGIDLVARMLMVTYNNWEDEVLKDQVRKAISGPKKIIKSKRFTKNLSICCYGGFLGENMENEVIKAATDLLETKQKKNKRKQSEKEHTLALTHGSQYFMWWHYRPAPFHFEQYMRELLVQVKKGPTWSCQTTTDIQKMDLWLEAIASMPITFIWKHVDVDKMKKYAAQCFALCIEKKTEQLLHLNMMVQHILLVSQKKNLF